MNDPTRETLWAPTGGERCDLAEAVYVRRRSELVEGPDGARFVHVAERPPRLVVIGASHLAVHLARMARELDFETIVVDPRSALASPERFDPPPDLLLVSWPEAALNEIGLDDESYVVALSHDPKLDDPALIVALASSAPYVGALGGRQTQEARRGRLRDQGLADPLIERLRGPVGLPIGARTPGEVAVAILAEIVHARRLGG